MRKLIPVYILIKRLANCQRRLFERQPYLRDLGSAKGKTLHFLFTHESEDVFQKDIEEEFGLRPPTATAMLKAMEASGLIERVPMARDGRLKRILPTKKALLYREGVFKAVDEVNVVMSEGIPPDDLACWEKVMIQMINNIKEK